MLTVITVRVGTEGIQRDFSVHKGLISSHSPFFKAAMNEQWEEGRTNLITLPEDDPDVFKLYCCWLYNIYLVTKQERCVDQNNEDLYTGSSENARLVKAYTFGNKILDHSFCDMIVDQMIVHSHASDVFYIANHYQLFNLMRPEHPARQLLGDVVNHVMTEENLKTAMYDAFDGVAWKEIMGTFLARRSEASPQPWELPWKVDKCRYHHHTKYGGECYRHRPRWGAS